MPTCKMPPSKPTARLPTTTPTTISISATEIPVRIEIKLASSASPIQTAAINQMLSSIKNSFRLEGVISSREFSVAAATEGKLHCLGKVYRVSSLQQPKHSPISAPILPHSSFGFRHSHHILKR